MTAAMDLEPFTGGYSWQGQVRGYPRTDNSWLTMFAFSIGFLRRVLLTCSLSHSPDVTVLNGLEWMP